MNGEGEEEREREREYHMYAVTNSNYRGGILTERISSIHPRTSVPPLQ